MGGTQGTRRLDTGASALMVYIHTENLGNENTGVFQLSIAMEWNNDSKPSQ